MFRQQRHGKGFAKLNLVEMYSLLRFFDVQDLARTQQCSRAFCFVAGQPTLWFRLAVWRKQHCRLETSFCLRGQVTRLEGREYLKIEHAAYQAQKREKSNQEYLDKKQKCRAYALYPHGPETFTDEIPDYYSKIFGIVTACCIAAGLPAIILVAKRADDKNKEGDWSDNLIPSYFILAFVLLIILCLFRLFCSNPYTGNLRSMRWSDFTVVFLLQWFGRVTMVYCFINLILFASNLSLIGDGDENSPATYVVFDSHGAHSYRKKITGKNQRSNADSIVT
jgi:hypothetical protein